MNYSGQQLFILLPHQGLQHTRNACGQRNYGKAYTPKQFKQRGWRIGIKRALPGFKAAAENKAKHQRREQQQQR